MKIKKIWPHPYFFSNRKHRNFYFKFYELLPSLSEDNDVFYVVLHYSIL